MAAAACGPKAAPTYFVPPTAAGIAPAALPAVPEPAATSTPEVVLEPTPPPPTPTPPCEDGLTYVQDLSIPDGTLVTPGQLIDKRWEVTNSGSCNWDQRYRLTLVNGDALGAEPALALYPARAGAQATLSIQFTAPAESGTYECQWQATNPDGLPFGDTIYMQVVVPP